MSRVETAAWLAGVPELERKVRLMDTRVQARIRNTVRTGTNAVTAGAYQRAPKVSGELAYSIRSEFAKDGLTGYTKAGFGKLLRRTRATKNVVRYQRAKERAQARAEHLRMQSRLANNSRQALSAADLGVYAPVVERGDRKRNKPKREFLYPSFDAEKDGIQSQMRRDLQRSADEVAA